MFLDMPDTDFYGVSYKDRVPKILLDYIDRFLSLDQYKPLWPELKEKQAKLEDFDPAQRTCPICAGTMFDLAVLLNMPVTINGMEINTLLDDRDSYGHYIPQQWECAKCGAFDIPKPDLQGMAAKIQGEGSFGFELQKFNPIVEEVFEFEAPIQQGWFLRIEEEWFHLHGMRERAEVAIGMKEMDWEENERRGREWLKMKEEQAEEFED